MELTRRDALAVLGLSASSAGCLAGDPDTPTADRSAEAMEKPDRETYIAVARVVYPSEVSGVEDFVRTYLSGRADAETFDIAAARASLEAIDAEARYWFDDSFRALDPENRDVVLDRMGLRDADPDPAGSMAEQTRYYVLNELLFALYASPTGGELVGLENPPGHPGGIRSYRRGPGDG